MLTLQEVAATMEHHRRALLGSDHYYREKYSGIWDKLKSLTQLVLYTFSGFIWGHGEKPANTIISLICFLFTLSFFNFWFVLNNESWNSTKFGIEILKYVVDTFLNLPPDQRFSGFIWVDYLIAIARYVYVGIFVSILFKSISHR